MGVIILWESETRPNLFLKRQSGRAKSSEGETQKGQRPAIRA